VCGSSARLHTARRSPTRILARLGLGSRIPARPQYEASAYIVCGAMHLPLLRMCQNIVLDSTKYCIGVLTIIPVSIGNILKYWFLTDPTKYWHILEICDPWLRNFNISSRHDLFFKKLGGLGQFGVFIA
jgi:hypothetical protein